MYIFFIYDCLALFSDKNNHYFNTQKNKKILCHKLPKCNKQAETDDYRFDASVISKRNMCIYTCLTKKAKFKTKLRLLFPNVFYHSQPFLLPLRVVVSSLSPAISAASQCFLIFILIREVPRLKPSYLSFQNEQNGGLLTHPFTAISTRGSLDPLILPGVDPIIVPGMQTSSQYRIMAVDHKTVPQGHRPFSLSLFLSLSYHLSFSISIFLCVRTIRMNLILF